MNWDAAIDSHKASLLRILAVLTAWVGLIDGAGPAELPSYLYRKVLSVLGPAESALRRLIVIAARDVSVPVRPKRPVPPGLSARVNAERIRAFPLYDPRIDLTPLLSGPRANSPRILSVGEAYPGDGRAIEAETVDAAPIYRRLQSMQRALADLKRQARRMARAEAARLPKRPTRPGRPPGYRRRPVHAVDTLLQDLHELALWAQAPPGTPMVLR